MVNRMPHTVDSFRFTGGITRRMLETWIKQEKTGVVPWAPLTKPLKESTVALLSSGGIALKTDKPFDQEGERRNPWWGDPSYRIIPNTATERDIEVYHLHINPEFARQDLNCLLPIQRLAEMQAAGEIGKVAPSHFSIMGYLPDPDEMLATSVPAIIQRLKDERVDILVLVPS
jgi:D-proline reductase (dithiol) PrdB